MVRKPNVFRMETHCPGDFWDGVHGLAHLLHWILLLSASKPGNAIIFSSEFFGDVFLIRAQWKKPLKIRSLFIWDIF
jgi:hypothetical protein